MTLSTRGLFVFHLNSYEYAFAKKKKDSPLQVIWTGNYTIERQPTAWHKTWKCRYAHVNTGFHCKKKISLGSNIVHLIGTWNLKLKTGMLYSHRQQNRILPVARLYHICEKKTKPDLVFSSNEKEQSAFKDGDLLLEDLSDQHFNVLTNHNLVTI